MDTALSSISTSSLCFAHDAVQRYPADARQEDMSVQPIFTIVVIVTEPCKFIQSLTLIQFVQFVILQAGPLSSCKHISCSLIFQLSHQPLMAGWGSGLGEIRLEPPPPPPGRRKKEKKEKEGAAARISSPKRYRAEYLPPTLALPSALQADAQDVNMEGVNKGKGGGKGEKLTAMKFSKDQAALVATVVKQVLNNTQQIRDLTAVSLDVFKVTSTDQIVVHGRATLRTYGAKCRELGREHQFGPPALHTFRSLLTSFLLRSGQIGPELTQYITAMTETKFSQEEMFTVIRHCSYKTCYDTASTRFVLGIRELPTHEMLLPDDPLRQKLCVGSLRHAVLNCLKRCGAQTLTGRAPVGAMQNTLFRVLEAAGDEE